MPTLTDALEFVQDPETSLSRLRRACAILELEAAGTREALRERLLAHLSDHPPDEEVVCLNPNLPTVTGDEIIRQAGGDDVIALSNLACLCFTEAFGFSMSETDLSAHLSRYLSPASFSSVLEQSTVLLAESRSQMIGYVQWGDYLHGERGDKEIARLYVLSTFQNRGIGASLMEAALERMRGAPAVYLDVWAKNEAAIRFYRRYGFEVIGTRVFDMESGPAEGLDLIMVRREPND